ncbi:MAG: hypothetical protein ABL961_14695 [Vicinamibacterales bacterium]
MPVETTDPILPLVGPGEVAALAHQPHQEEPGLAARPVDVDQGLEEVDLGETARSLRQRHEDLAPLPLPLRYRGFDHRDAPPGGPRRRPARATASPSALPAPGPLGRLGQQRFDAPAAVLR